MISAGTEILELSEREHTYTRSPSSRATHHNSRSGENAACGDISPIKDDPNAEHKDEDSSNDEALTPDSTHSDICHGGDANVQDESLVERSLFEASSSSDVPLERNASKTDVIQVMALSPALLFLKDHLTEMEHRWVELHADVTAVQQTLHQVKKTLFYPDHDSTGMFCSVPHTPTVTST